jgi:hypothetical protein
MFSSLAPSSQSADFPNTDMVRSDSQIFSPPPSSITPLLPSTTNQSSQESKQLISPVVDGDALYLIMTGQAAVLNASKSPAVVATENAEVATAPSVSIGIGLSS